MVKFVRSKLIPLKSWFAILLWVSLTLLMTACSGQGRQDPPTLVNTRSATPSLTDTPSLTVTPIPPTSTRLSSTALPPADTPQRDPVSTPTPANVDKLPAADLFTWEVIAGGLDRPVGLAAARDNSGRLFVIEQPGLIRVIHQGEILSEPFMDLRDRVSMRGGAARGLLGLVFHPEFAENGNFYVHYTDENANSVIARFTAYPDLTAGEPSSEKKILEISYPVGEHVGGDLHFGTEGYLYISIGDGGGPGYGDQDGHAQNPDSLLGKILRLDVDGGDPYRIPEDNPYSSGDGRGEVWVSGLRNPWRFEIDSLTGEFYIADVGENRIEELNYLPADSPGGSNFGWNYFEGSLAFGGLSADETMFTGPVYQYEHSEGCSITGGRVYRGSILSDWYGVYLFGDYCQGKIWGLLRTPDGEWVSDQLYKLPAYITSFGVDEAGEIYLTDMTGKVYQLVEK